MSRSCNSNLRLRRAGAERNIFGSATLVPDKVITKLYWYQEFILVKSITRSGGYTSTSWKFKFISYIRPQLLEQQEIKLSAD
jgi:hypothetical protein